jgi:outer membrane protein TolC
MKIYKMKYYLSLFMALFVLLKANAQSAFSLDEAVDYGIKNHGSIKNARVGIQDAELQIKEIKAAGLPQVNGQFSFTYNAIVPTTLIDPSSFGPPNLDPNAPKPELSKVKFGLPWGAQAGVGINQLIFDATWLVGLRAADTYRLMADQEVEKSKTIVAETVQKAYYSTMVAEQRSQLLDLNLTRMDSAIFQTEQFFKAGFVEKIDIDRLKVQRNNLLTEKAKIKNLIALSYQLLKFQMGYPQNEPLELKEKLNADIVKDMINLMSTEINPESRIEFKQLETSRKLTLLNMERISKTQIPSVSFSGSLGAGHTNSVFNPFERWFGASALSIGVRIPIYDSGLRRIQVERQRLNLIKIDNGADLLKESFKLELGQAKVNLKNGFEALGMQEQNLELANEVLRVSKIKFQQGLGSSLEVVNAETDVKQSQNNYLSALYDVLIGKVDFDKIQGKLIKNN